MCFFGREIDGILYIEYEKIPRNSISDLLGVKRIAIH